MATLMPTSLSCQQQRHQLIETALIETALIETALIETALIETALIKTNLIKSVPTNLTTVFLAGSFTPMIW